MIIYVSRSFCEAKISLLIQSKQVTLWGKPHWRRGGQGERREQTALQKGWAAVANISSPPRAASSLSWKCTSSSSGLLCKHVLPAAVTEVLLGPRRQTTLRRAEQSGCIENSILDWIWKTMENMCLRCYKWSEKKTYWKWAIQGFFKYPPQP